MMGEYANSEKARQASAVSRRASASRQEEQQLEHRPDTADVSGSTIGAGQVRLRRYCACSVLLEIRRYVAY
jgi:hypothetical protein